MHYYVIEIQTYENGTSTIVTPINEYENRQEAESKYHAILAVAATSKVAMHTAVLMTETGRALMSQFYEHVTGMAPEVEE